MKRDHRIVVGFYILVLLIFLGALSLYSFGQKSLEISAMPVHQKILDG
jgi:hypothetical protein